MGSNRNGNRGHLEIVSYETDYTNEGVMVFPGSPPTTLPVQRSEKNDHLFMYNSTSERFEVLHYGSALLVSLLRMHEPPQASRQKTVTHLRELALFDTEGEFHDRLLLREPLFPRETDSGIPAVRHTAFFDETQASGILPFTIPIDDIYCLSLAKPPAAA